MCTNVKSPFYTPETNILYANHKERQGPGLFFFFFKSIFDRVIIKLSGIHLKQCRYGNLFFSSLNFMTGKYRSVIFDDNFST